MTTLVWLVIALPLAGAAILLLAGRRTDSWGHLLGCLAALASFAAGVVLFVDMLGRHAEDRIVHEALFSWVPVAGLHVDFGLQLDVVAGADLRHHPPPSQTSGSPSGRNFWPMKRS